VHRLQQPTLLLRLAPRHGVVNGVADEEKHEAPHGGRAHPPCQAEPLHVWSVHTGVHTRVCAHARLNKGQPSHTRARAHTLHARSHVGALSHVACAGRHACTPARALSHLRAHARPLLASAALELALTRSAPQGAHTHTHTHTHEHMRTQMRMHAWPTCRARSHAIQQWPPPALLGMLLGK